MSYTKKVYTDFETVIEAADMNRIEEGIATIHNDLYDDKVAIEWETTYSSIPDITKPVYEKEWATAEFSGWWGYIGQPQNFSRVEFPIKARSGYNCTSVTIKILEMPDISEVTFGTWGVSPTPASWKLVAETIYNFTADSPLSTGAYTIVKADLGMTVENTEKKHYAIAILGNARCTFGYCKVTWPDIPYNPWIYYAIDGKNGCGPLSGAGYTYDSTSKSVLTMPVRCSRQGEIVYYSELGTSKKDKFFELVNTCVANSDSFSDIFDEKYVAAHLTGSQNFEITKGGTAHSTTTTFTGVIFPIGVVPSSLVSNGCSFRIKARKSDSGDTTPITEVYAWLYSVEEIPYQKDPGYQFNTLNPTLLRTGKSKCNIAVDTEDIVSIQWEEGEFSNTENKFLMLGYNCNSLNNRCFNADKKNDKQVVTEVDGNTYTNTFETWYSTQKTQTPAWAPRWANQYANAWSLNSIAKVYTLGDNFNAVLNKALDEALADYDFDTEPIPTSEVRLAKQYDLVVGDTFQLFYDGVIKAVDVSKENVAVRCSKGKTYMRYWEYTPKAGEEGTYTLSLYTRYPDGSVISSGTTNIVVHPKLTDETTPSNLTALIFGDSLTVSGAWAAEGFRRIYGATDSSASGPTSLGLTNTLTTYGTKRDTTNTFAVSHEGYGGWTWNSFLAPGNSSSSTVNGIIVTMSAAHGYDLNTMQKSSWTDNNGLLWQLEDFPSTTQIKFNRGTGNNATQANTATPTSLYCDAHGLTITPATVVWEAANPFYDAATQSVSFAAHASANGVTAPDIVTCLLTWNGGGGDISFNHTSQINTHMTKAKELLSLIHSDFPDAKIIAMGIQLPSITGGNGHNEGANGFYSDTPNIVDYAFEYNKALENLLTTDTELKTYCYYVDTKGQFDTKYNMPWAEYPVNTRSSTKEMRGTNGVHPSTAGYYQIGDAFYRALHKVIPIVKTEKESA